MHDLRPGSASAKEIQSRTADDGDCVTEIDLGARMLASSRVPHGRLIEPAELSTSDRLLKQAIAESISDIEEHRFLDAAIRVVQGAALLGSRAAGYAALGVGMVGVSNMAFAAETASSSSLGLTVASLALGSILLHTTEAISRRQYNPADR